MIAKLLCRWLGHRGKPVFGPIRIMYNWRYTRDVTRTCTRCGATHHVECWAVSERAGALQWAFGQCEGEP